MNLWINIDVANDRMKRARAAIKTISCVRSGRDNNLARKIAIRYLEEAVKRLEELATCEEFSPSKIEMLTVSRDNEPVFHGKCPDCGADVGVVEDDRSENNGKFFCTKCARPIEAKCPRCGGFVDGPVEDVPGIPRGMIGRRFCETCGEVFHG